MLESLILDNYTFYSFVSICVLASIHLFADKIDCFSFLSKARFLSAGGGIALSYVFIDLLPKLSKSDHIVKTAFAESFPYFERHVYIMALLGFLLFYIVDRAQKTHHSDDSFWLSISTYSFFNFLMGYAIVDPNDIESQPLSLFTFAMSLHYFTNDYSLSLAHGSLYKRFGRWVIASFLFIGWITGYFFTLSETAVAILSAFIGGGVIMNVIRHELPEENPNNIGSFITSSILYMFILLLIGA